MTTVDVSETRPGSVPSCPLDAGAFAPGTMLGDRYRVVALAGRGGMGEVYRAEDLRLGQTVALKFLPADLERDAVARERLLAEVRNARTVSHPNVCRVYDVGEVQGRSFLTMEYIDGEDLASLLRRIGRLPADKVVEVARQLCAGLAAAHDRGLLHRDLKPANVMIDGRGRARITDFGLAVEAGASTSPADVAGTVAYMAPERFQGAPATVQSDLYSLGLIVCTKRARGDLHSRRRRWTSGSEPTRIPRRSVHRRSCRWWSPPSRAPSCDAWKSVLSGARHPRPRWRPHCRAAIRSPQPWRLVKHRRRNSWRLPAKKGHCHAGRHGCGWQHAWRRFRCPSRSCRRGPWKAASPSRTLNSRRNVHARYRDLGHGGPVADEAWWVRRNNEYLEHYRNLADGGRALETAVGRPESLLFCYRQSPWFLSSASGQVSGDEPSPVLAGDAYLELGTDGRLVSLRVVPPGRQPLGPDTKFDWSPLLASAGLRPDQLTRVEPSWGPIFAFDTRAAWEGSKDNERVRVEVAAFDGRRTYLRVAPTWMAEPVPPGGPAWSLFSWIVALLYLGGIAFLAALAWRNLRLGRGDRRSALRLTGLVFAIDLLGEVLSRHWTAAPGGPGTIGPIAQVVSALARPLFLAAATWLGYVGLEPFVRRQFPHVLIASTRLLDGRWRDALVGRSVITGVLASIVMLVVMAVFFVSSSALGGPAVAPGFTPAPPATTLVSFAADVAGTTAVYVWTALLYLGVLLLARWVLRSARAAWFGLAAVFFIMYAAWGGVYIGPSPLLFIPFGMALAATSTWVLWKSGVLTLAIWLIVLILLRDTPWSLDLTRWSAGPTWLSAALIAGLAIWAFKSVLGRQSALPAGLPDA